MGNLGKLIAAKGFKKLPKVQKIAQSGHTACSVCTHKQFFIKTDIFKLDHFQKMLFIIFATIGVFLLSEINKNISKMV